MGNRAAAVLLAVSLVLAGCGAEQPQGPAPLRFTEVQLPAGTTPTVLTPVGDTLLIGVRRDGQPVVPGLLRRGPDGRLAEIPVSPAGMYGEQAFWYSITAEADRIVAIGGRTGGAHGNVRWTVWTGSDAGLAERPQPFSTFGGYGAGALVDAVLTPAGAALVGSWQNPTVGLDIMVWRPAGRYWVRRPVAGTALENTRESLKFPLSAAAAADGAVIAGWELSDGRQHPAVWRSPDLSTWTMTRLPSTGRSGAAMSLNCANATCTVAGWVDGNLALWRLTGDKWTRVPRVPQVPVAPDTDLPAPVTMSGHPTAVVNDASRVLLAGSSLRPAEGPTGKVTAATQVGHTLYVAAGDHLWQTEVAP